MKKLIPILLCVLLWPLSAPAQSTGELPVGPGDMLSIIVFGEPDLSLKKVRVGADGSVSMPLLGQVKVGGYSIRKLEDRLTSMLAAGYLRDPKVTVSVLDYRPFFVYGEVNKPGGYPYADDLTVEKAVALAGGFTPRASKRKVTLERKGKAVGGRKVDLKTSVLPGDVITVGESFF